MLFLIVIIEIIIIQYCHESCTDYNVRVLTYGYRNDYIKMLKMASNIYK